MRGLLVCLLAVAHCNVLRERLLSSTHGTFSSTASMQLLWSKVAVSRVKVHDFCKMNTKRAILRACLTLRDQQSYSILQLRSWDDSASLYICKPRNEEATAIVSILSTGGGTPLSSLREATAWHEKTFPNVTLVLDI